MTFMVSAENTVKTIEIPFGYIGQTVANTWYQKDMTITSPDGIMKILSIEFIAKGDYQANTKIYIGIEGEACEEEYWTIPNKDVADYNVFFDCSNLAQGKTSGLRNRSRVLAFLQS